MPQTFLEVALFVLFIVPGITFATIRVALVGWRSPDISVAGRILEALFVSVLFDGIYLLIGVALNGGYLLRAWKGEENPLDDFQTWAIAALGLLLLVAVPAATSVLLFLRVERLSVLQHDGTAKKKWVKMNNYRAVPQAWDHIAMGIRSGRFVRVRTEGGIYYGGWYSTKSLMSTYPNPRDIFIETQWKMSKDGEFVGRMKSTKGVWLAIPDKSVVEWLEAPSPTKKEQRDD